MAAFQIATTLLWVSVCRSILIHAFEECISTPIPLPIDNPRIGVPQVVTSSNTYIWSIFMNRGDTVRVFYCKHPCNGHWEDSDQMQSMAEQFDLDASGEYICGVNAFRVFCRSEESLTWNLANVSTVDQDGSGYPLNLVDIAVSKRTKYIWGVNDTRVYFCERSNRDNFVYSCVQPNDTETLILQIDAGDEEVWGVNASHYIFKRPVNGSGEWTMVPGTMRYVSASGSNYIWGIAPNNSLFNCEMPCTGDWQYIGGSFRQIDGFNEYTIGVDINNTTQSLSCTLSGGKQNH